MSKIVIGKAGKNDVAIDLDVLIRTRLLIQANSGKGKSWLLRRLAEQLFGKVQVIILDPEGEFASLREKYGFVLVGKSGDTPADPRSAALVARRLLELRASAVCDIYELPPAQREAWAKSFLESMIDAPKNLWHPVVVILDEAHVFCPEKGAGESTASEAVIGLATRGRKRGFCLVMATQRLGKLRKDAAAEMLNVMVGGTMIDVDRKRAADALGFYDKAKNAFFDEIKMLPRGEFYALGPAIGAERVLVTVGSVETTHPEAGSAKHAAEPPPAPEAIAKLLPKLSDLPKAAEEQAKNEAELKREIRELRAQLRAQPKPLPEADPRAIERAVRLARVDMDRFAKDLEAGHRDIAKRIYRVSSAMAAAAEELSAVVGRIAALTAPTIVVHKIPGGEIHKEGRSPTHTSASAGAQPPARIPTQTHPRPDVYTEFTPNGDGELAPYHISILRGLAELRAIGKASPSYALVAAAAGRSRSGAWDKAVARLRKLGLIASAPGGGALTLTEKGIEAAPAAEQAISSDALQARVQSILDPYQLSIFNAALRQWPEAVSLDQLAADANRSRSGAWDKKIASLRKMSILENAGPGEVRAANWLFLE